MTGLSPQGAQQARSAVAAQWLRDHLPTPLLDHLLADPDDESRWAAVCLPSGLSGGETVAVRWLARRTWSSGEGDWWPVVTWDDVVARCDRRLVQALDEVGRTLTTLTAMEEPGYRWDDGSAA